MEHQTNSPLVSIIVPCRGHANELKNCLRGLEKQAVGWSYQIIVVDSASDPAVARVVSAFPLVRLIRSQSMLLPGDARNLGVKYARGYYLAFIDADCIPEKDWLGAAISALNDGAKLVGGAVLDVHPLHLVAAADNLLQFYEYSPHRPDGVTSHLPGCNLALSRTDFDRLSGFPTGFQVGEDTILSSAAATQWPGGVRFVSGMRVRHCGRTQLRTFWRHQAMFGFGRGRLGSRLRPICKRLGKTAIFAALIGYFRLGYIVFCTAKWDHARLLRIILLMPILLLGLTAWGKGFWHGCRQADLEARRGDC